MERPRIIQGAPKDHPTPRKEQPLGTAQVAPKTTQDAPKTHPRRTWSIQESSKEHPRITRAHAWSSQGSLRPTQGRGAPPWTHGPCGPWTLRVQAAPLWRRGKARHRGRCRADRIVSEDLWAPPRAHLQRGGGTSSGAGIGYPRLGRPPPRGAGNLVWSDGLGAGLHGVATQKTAAPQKKGLGRRGGNKLKSCPSFSNLFETLQHCSNILKPLQTCSKRYKTSQTFSNLFKPSQTSSNLS